MLLLHGLASYSGIWDLLAPHLAAHFRVVAMDLRGHGQSSKPSDGYDFDTVARDVRDFCGALGLTSPIVVGHSWGGNVALHYAVSFPTMVSGLVMVDGGFIEPSANPQMTWERAQVEMAPPPWDGVTMDSLLARVKQGDLGPLWDSQLERVLKGNFYTLESGEIRPNLSRDNHMKIVKALWEHRPSALYSRIPCPALVLAAWKTPRRSTVFHDMKRQLVGQVRLPRGRVMWMEDTVHDIPLQRPVELSAIIVEFARTFQLDDCMP